MANLLGTVSGQIKIDVSQALAAYVAVQKANRDTTNALRQISGTLNTVGNAVGIVGIGLATALGYAAKQAADFNAQMSYFQAISGSTTAQMEAVRQKALQLDQTTMFSTKDIANMFVELAKAGEGAKDITGGVADAVVNLAQAAQIPLDSAVTTVVSVLNAYGLSAAQAAEVSDRLAGAANASIVDVSDLATSLKYVSGVAHQLGIGFDETTTALDLLGQAGLKGSMAGTSLRQIMVSILGTTKPAAAELEKLGIITKDGANQFFDSTGKAKGLAEIFQILQDHLRGLNQEQQLAAIKTIFNNRALSAAAILTREGAKGFKDMNAAMSGTTAADVAAKRMDNLQGDVKKLTSSLQTMAIQAGQPLQDFLRQVVQGLNSLVHWFENLSPATQANIIHTLAIAAALLIAASALIKIVGFAVKLWETFGRLAQAARFLWGVLAAVGEGIIDLGAAILASPIGIIIAIVIALGVAFYLLYEKVKPVRDFFNAVGRDLKGAFEATVRWFETLPRFFEHVWADIKQWFSDGINGIVGAWNSVVDFFKRIGEDIKNGVTGAYNSVVSFFQELPGRVERWVGQVAQSVGNFFQNLPYKLGYWLGYALGTLIRWQAEAAKAFVDWLIQVGEDVGDFFVKLPGRLANWLTQAATSISNWTQTTITNIINWVTQVDLKIADFFEKLPGRVWNWLVSTAASIANFENNVVISVVRWLGNFGQSVANFFSALPGRIGNWLNQVINNIINWGNNAVNWAGTIGLNFVNGILNFLNQLPGLVWQTLNNAIQTFENMVGSAFDAAVNFAKGLWDGFKHGLGIHSPSYIEVAMTNITDHMMTQTDKIGNYVKKINGLGQQMMDLNPATVASSYSAVLATSLNGQTMMQGALRSMLGPSNPGYYLSSQAGASAQGYGQGEQSGPTKVLEVNVYNPVAEDSATSTTQKLSTLAAMGAF